MPLCALATPSALHEVPVHPPRVSLARPTPHPAAGHAASPPGRPAQPRLAEGERYTARRPRHHLWLPLPAGRGHKVRLAMRNVVLPGVARLACRQGQEAEVGGQRGWLAPRDPGHYLRLGAHAGSSTAATGAAQA